MRLRVLLRLPARLRRRARRNRIMTLLLLLLLLLVPALLLASTLVVYYPPRPLIRWLARRFPDVLWHVPLPADRRMVALTIDDAPSSHTPELLALLAAHGAHATLFVIGAQAEEPGRDAVLADAVAAGHELGNHAMRDEASAGLSDGRLRDDIEHVRGIIAGAYRAGSGQQKQQGQHEQQQQQQLSPHANYFRPGGGFFTPRMRRLVDRLGHRLVLGNVYPHDPQIPWPRLNAWYVLRRVRPGSIVICHDRRSWTAPMLKVVLPELRRRGYEIVTVSRLVEEGERVAEAAAGRGHTVLLKS